MKYRAVCPGYDNHIPAIRNSSIPYNCRHKRKGFTLVELLVFIWVLIFAMNGFSKGIRFGSQYDPRGAVLGAVGGFLVGAIIAIALMVLYIYTIDKLYILSLTPLQPRFQ